MVTITLKTPHSNIGGKRSTIIPHLVEHTASINSKLTPQSFFDLVADTDPTYYGTFTKIDLPDSMDWKKYITLLTQPISQELFEHERHALKQELTYTKESEINKLYTKIESKLYGSLSTAIKKPTFQDFTTYHQTYYIPQNMIVSWKDDKLLYIGKNFSKKSTNKSTITSPKYFTLGKWQLATHCIVFPYSSWEMHRYAYFLYDILKQYTKYIQRYTKGIYDYQTPYYFHTQSHIVISFSISVDSNITSEFFKAYQEYYLTHIDTRYDTYRKIIDCIYWHGYTTSQKAISLLSQITHYTTLWRLKKR
jgi:hypothetical protein